VSVGVVGGPEEAVKEGRSFTGRYLALLLMIDHLNLSHG
jgi:hypothetical protein